MKERKNLTLEEAGMLAQTDTAKQLYATLQATHSDELNTAMEQVTSGDYNALRDTVTKLFSDPQTQALIKQLREG